MTTFTTPPAFALRRLDGLIPATARAEGVETWPAPLDWNDAKATRHLKGRGMGKRRARRPVALMDDQGDLILRIPLDNRGQRFAVVDPADWVALQVAGCDGLWNCADNGTGYLTVKTHRPMAQGWALNHVIVARMILGLAEDAQTHFRSRDTLDLRRANLDSQRVTNPPHARPAQYDARRAVRVGAERRATMAA